MVDFSVVGEILGETNLDNVGDSIADSVEEVADSMENAGISAEGAEESLDDVRDSFAGIIGAAEDADDEIDDVGDELNDLTADAQGANASVATLAGSLAALDAKDVDIDVDTERGQNLLSRLNDLAGDVDGDIGRALTLGLQKGVDDDGSLADVATNLNDMAGDALDMEDVLTALNDTLMMSDDSIQTLNDRYQMFRNEIDDFDDRVDDVIPRRVTGRPTEDFPQDVRETEQALGNVGGAIDNLEFLRQQRQAAEESGRRNVVRIPESISSRPSLRKTLFEELEFGRGGKGTLGSILSGDEGSSLRQLAQRIAGAGNIESSVDEVVDALRVGLDDVTSELEEAADVAEDATDNIETSLVPVREQTTDIVPRRTTLSRGGFNFDQAVESSDFKFDQPLEDAFETFDFDDEPIAQPGTVVPTSVEEALDMEDIRAVEIDRANNVGFRNVAEALSQIETITDSAEEIESSLRETAEAQRNRLPVPREQVERGARRVDEAVEAGRRAELQNLVGGFDDENMQGIIGSDVDSFGKITTGRRRKSRIEKISDTFTGLTETASEAGSAVSFVGGAIRLFTGDSKSGREAIEELDEGFEDIQHAIDNVLPALENISANLGPFNVSFGNLFITLTSLVAVVGALGSVLIALVAAIGAVVAALGSLLAVGAIGFVEELKNEFAGINTTMEAVEATAKAMKNVLLDALAPLEAVTLGGLGPTDVFITFLQDVVRFTELFAESMATLLEMDEMQEFLIELRAAVLGFSDELSGLTMTEGFARIVEEVVPILQDLLIFFIDALPEMLAFTAMITDRLGPALSNFGSSFIDFVATMTLVGQKALGLLLPALTMMLKTLTLLFDTVIMVSNALGPLAPIIGVTVIALIGLVSITLKTITVAFSLFQAMAAVNTMFEFFAGTTIPSYIGATTAAQRSTMALRAAMIALQTTGILVFLTLATVGLLKMKRMFGTLPAVITGVTAAFGGLTAAVVAGSSIMASALIGTGVGAIIVGIGLALAFVYRNWNELTSAFEKQSTVVQTAIASMFGPLGILIFWITKVRENLGQFKQEWENITAKVDMLINRIKELRRVISGGLVGAALGFAIGGPPGAAVGAAAGSGIGAAATPEVRQQLSSQNQQRSSGTNRMNVYNTEVTVRGNEELDYRREKEIENRMMTATRRQNEREQGK